MSVCQRHFWDCTVQSNFTYFFSSWLFFGDRLEEQALEATFLHHFLIWPSRWWNEVGRNLLLKFHDHQLYTFVLYVMWKIDFDLLCAPFPQWCTENFLWFGFLWSPCWTRNGWWGSVTGFWCQYTGSNCKISPARHSSNSGLCLKSRAHLTRKHTWPPDLVFASLSQLGTLYVQKGRNQAYVYQALQL